MAAHRFARAFVQLRKIVRLRKNGFAHGAGREAAFRGLLDDENDFAHGWIIPLRNSGPGPEFRCRHIVRRAACTKPCTTWRQPWKSTNRKRRRRFATGAEKSAGTARAPNGRATSAGKAR